jgi:sialate O-acetylesterase
MHLARCLLWLPLALVSLATTTLADVKLPAVFTDHMVLQRDQPVPVWGWADPNEQVIVTFRDQTKTTTAGADGKWSVKLDNLGLGEPGTLTVKGKNEVTRTDVLVGEVWVCSGQSNMQWAVNVALDPDLEAASANFPNLRLFQTPMVPADTPQQDVDVARGGFTWKVCTPDAVPTFSAVAFFFGRQLHQSLGVPVGVIQTAWGGTPAEAWTSEESLARTESLKPLLDKWEANVAGYNADKAEMDYQTALADWEQKAAQAKAENKPVPNKPQKAADPANSPHRPSNLFNAMVAPLAGYAIRGGIWYQGESNASRAYQYRTLMPLMIQSWREAWKQGEFSFYMVQLANFKPITDQPGDSDWAELREAQMLTIDAIPNVGVACITDIGAAKDIHPKDKQNVSKRLARLALVSDYGMSNITRQGPTYRSIDIQGNKITVHFETYGRPLVSYYGEPLTGFAIAGADKKWVWAEAKITGPDTVEVTHPEVSAPMAVRYNWADNPQGTLFSDAYLPAYPFRSDDWEGITVKAVAP